MKVGQLVEILSSIPSDLEVYISTYDETHFPNKSLGSVTSERVYGFVDVFNEAELKNKTIVVLGQRPFEPTAGD